MSVIRAKCTDQVLKLTEKPVIASGGVNEVSIEFTFCEKWDGYTKTGVFYRNEDEVYHAILDENDTCVIPWEVYKEPGYFYFNVFGNKDNVRRTSSTVRYRAQKGIVSDAMLPSEPSRSVYEQILSKLNASGLDSTAAALLITIMRNGVYSTDQSANITALETALASGGSGDNGGDDSGSISVTQNGTTLIISGVSSVLTVKQIGTTLALT